MAMDVKSSAQPKLCFIIAFKAVISVLMLSRIHKVSNEAGILPNESQPVIVQLIFFFKLWTYTPPILVKAAYNKSVPTAVVGGIPNHNKMGVINEPPPTPVSPTTKPTVKPAITNPI
ncbi:hypothetical protein D3C80_1239620 [compost metagenome]